MSFSDAILRRFKPIVFLSVMTALAAVQASWLRPNILISVERQKINYNPSAMSNV